MMSHKQQAEKQSAIDLQAQSNHREQQQFSRLSSSAIDENHVLVGGRITAASGATNPTGTSHSVDDTAVGGTRIHTARFNA